MIIVSHSFCSFIHSFIYLLSYTAKINYFDGKKIFGKRGAQFEEPEVEDDEGVKTKLISASSSS